MTRDRPGWAAKRPDEDRDRDGRIVARRVARWHIGDPDWADLIINAYLNPKTHQEQLEQEMKDND